MSDTAAPELSVVGLTVEGETTPLGLDEPHPRFGWQLTSNRRDVRQRSYRLCVVPAPRAAEPLVDTGVVDSPDCWLVEVPGLQLEACRRYFWQVEVWDDAGARAVSELSWWETALMGRPPTGDWISTNRPLDEHSDHRPSPFLRRRLSVGPGLVAARAYVTAAGLYELHCNGSRVGLDLLRPGWTEYDARVFYQTLDLTGHLTAGDNVVGLVLGDGWWAGHVGFGLNAKRRARTPAALAEFRLTYDDGRVDVVTTDSTWSAAFGPVLSADLLMGEMYDARRELVGWTDHDATESAEWQPAAPVDSVDMGEIVAQRGPSVRATQSVAAIAITEPIPGSYVIDFGQNLVGWVRLALDVPAGTIVRIRHVEMLQSDGSVYTENLRSARATDTYISAGTGRVGWEPTFTTHGFRYAEITGIPGGPTLSDVTAIVVHSDCPTAGTFTCSSDDVNQLQANIVWGQRGNFVEVPTDCPQRDERLGWMGDAQVFVRTASFNADVRGMLGRWLEDVQLAQRADGAFTDVVPASGLGGGTPAWGDAGVIVPWELYRAYGDRRILERALPSMCRWVDYIHANNPDRVWREARGSDYGDWVAIGSDTPKDLIGTAFFAHCARTVASAARVLGDDATASTYDALADDVCRAFVETYVDSTGAIICGTQTAYALAIRFGLLAPDLQAEAGRRLAADVAERGCLTTGFVGVRHLLPALTLAGRSDLAYLLLEHDGFPSWLYSVRRGATTIWERWDGWTDERGFQTPSMNSFNHYAYGAVGEWMYEVVGGLAPDDQSPGYRHVVIQPQPGGSITSARTRYRTPYGESGCSWAADAAGLRCDVTIAPNTTATVILPASDVGRSLREAGRPADEALGVHAVSRKGDDYVVEVGSGNYTFSYS
jgi:alpha-L-rhamnosidase